jgi:uncharacterized membrane protein (UPF0136 family)
MFTPLVARLVLLFYALLLAVGGTFGYVKAGSRPSLIAGVSSALLTLAALGLTFARPFGGFVFAAVLAFILCLFFNYRYVTTKRKFMPSGLLAAISLAVVCMLIVAVL